MTKTSIVAMLGWIIPEPFAIPPTTHVLPPISTDTAVALRAAEIDADAILLAKNVDGVYDSDPNINKDAVKYDELTYLEVISKGLKVMDSTASSLCMDNNIPLLVFGLDNPENIIKVLNGEKIGTVVK